VSAAPKGFSEFDFRVPISGRHVHVVNAIAQHVSDEAVGEVLAFAGNDDAAQGNHGAPMTGATKGPCWKRREGRCARIPCY
jgi:hypothetical protein